MAASRVSASPKRSRSATHPGFIEPCHPTERERPPSGGNWIHEIKADGYRAQLHLREGKVTIYSRRGYDWTLEFAAIARAAEALPDTPCRTRLRPAAKPKDMTIKSAEAAD